MTRSRHLTSGARHNAKKRKTKSAGSAFQRGKPPHENIGRVTKHFRHSERKIV